MPKIYLVAHIPADQIQSFLQAVRAWEGGRKEIEMAIKIDDENDEVESAAELMGSLMPEFKHFLKIPIPKKD